MTTHKINNREYLLLEVPEGYTKYSLEYNNVICHNSTGFEEIEAAPRCLTERQQIESLEVTAEILGIASELTEEQAKELVDKFTLLPTTENEGYKNYLTYAKGFKTAIESLHSLITSLGLNPERTLIIERKK